MNELQPDVAALEAAWHVTLPSSYRKALSVPDAHAGAADLLAAGELAGDALRHIAMYHRLLPFAWWDEETVYAFLIIPQGGAHLPVVCWEPEQGHCWPIASGYDSACARLEAEAEWEDELDGDEPAASGSDTEFARQLVKRDPGAVDAHLMLACHALASGDGAAARDHAHRAMKAAPWFADAHYVAGVIENALGDRAAAVQAWWRTLHCPIALSTSTDTYDLGAEQEDTEIHEAAVNALLACREAMPREMLESAAGRCALRPDTFASKVRLDLGAELAAAGDAEGAERETLNALTLATTDAEANAAYDALLALYERTGQAWDADRCRADRALESDAAD